MADDQQNNSAQIGDTDLSGDNPDPESDDNTLDAAQDMGLYPNATEENPVELGVDDQTKVAEIVHQDQD
jgi:hypothetical protein